MKPDLSKYKNLKIRVALSGGKDSMSLVHYLKAHAAEFGITVSALNCDHKIRGEASLKDSAFVKAWCKENGVPLLSYECDCVSLAKARCEGVEEAARYFRRKCYRLALDGLDFNGEKILEGADCIATAHHLNDNAETVLFNICRGSALAGVKGIYDCDAEIEGRKVTLIRPLITCSRAEIDAYAQENGVPYVVDETNFSDGYTRNYIRHNVLPALEKAVPNAAQAIFRFSRLAAEDSGFICSEMHKRGLIKFRNGVAYICFCESRVLFSRAAVEAVAEYFGKKDYTLGQINSLYNLQTAENGKCFEFLGLVARKEKDAVCIYKNQAAEQIKATPFSEFIAIKSNIYAGQPLEITLIGPKKPALKIDLDKIPQNAEIRFMQSGDKFTKFGGGTKSLGDYFTDKKIPLRLRKKIPLIAVGNDIYAVCGVEISEKVKITEQTRRAAYIVCNVLD